MKYYSTHYIISVNSDLEIMLKVASWNAEMRPGSTPRLCWLDKGLNSDHHLSEGATVEVVASTLHCRSGGHRFISQHGKTNK